VEKHRDFEISSIIYLSEHKVRKENMMSREVLVFLVRYRRSFVKDDNPVRIIVEARFTVSSPTQPASLE